MKPEPEDSKRAGTSREIKDTAEDTSTISAETRTTAAVPFCIVRQMLANFIYEYNRQPQIMTSAHQPSAASQISSRLVPVVDKWSRVIIGYRRM